MSAAVGGGSKRLRTRARLLATAARLIADGLTPSTTEVAEAAGVSRRTAYRYFPTQEQLLVESSLEQLRPEVEAALQAGSVVAAGKGEGGGGGGGGRVGRTRGGVR